MLYTTDETKRESDSEGFRAAVRGIPARHSSGQECDSSLQITFMESHAIAVGFRYLMRR